MEITGELIEVFGTQDVTATFKKREFAVKTYGEYAQEIGLEVTQDKVDLLDTFKHSSIIFLASLLFPALYKVKE